MTHHWDELSKSLAEPLPRRESLRRLGLVVVGTVLSPLGLESAFAGKTDPCKSFCKCRNKRQKDECLKICKACHNDPRRLVGSCGSYYCCGADQFSCGGYCADLAHDAYNCGACGYACGTPDPNERGVCTEGQCVYACVPGAVRCNGRCTLLGWDQFNCGACGHVCPASTPVCHDGTCIGCQPPLTNCSGVCTDLDFDSANCGACGLFCPSYHVCYYGECQFYCDPDGPYPCW